MYPSDDSNPFAPIRASDYTDKQINELWVELGGTRTAAILEPRLLDTKYILGSKGSGKTHLLRYHSYQVSRQRSSNRPGLSLIEAAGCLAVFLRTANIDPSRFVMMAGPTTAWQHLFSIHLELRLTELVLEALIDIKNTTPNENFDDQSILTNIGKFIVRSEDRFHSLANINDFLEWTRDWLRTIDEAVASAAFTEQLEIIPPFAIGGLCLTLGAALREWNATFAKFNLIYVLDEIENLTEGQQEVVNTLVRYSEGRVAFRLTGRLYSRKTLATIADGEENVEGSEFYVVRLDEVLRSWQNYSDFARKFVSKRMGGGRNTHIAFDPKEIFEEVQLDDFIQKLAISGSDNRYLRSFVEATSKSKFEKLREPLIVENLIASLTEGIPPLLQRLNVLLFCKKFSKSTNPEQLAIKIRGDCLDYMLGRNQDKKTYKTAFGHWKLDLFAQFCKDVKRKDNYIPYAGFNSLIEMSAHNPRNILVLLAKIYEVANFKEFSFRGNQKLPVEIQSEAAVEAARFSFEKDANYGRKSEAAREASARLAELLRTARFSLNIPEVSPLAVSFSNEKLNDASRQTLELAINYSFLHEVSAGRTDRNNQQLKRKIQLNPMLSPRWGLPIGRRGDISLDADIMNSIFDPTAREYFEHLLRQLSVRWNLPFTQFVINTNQADLF